MFFFLILLRGGCGVSFGRQVCAVSFGREEKGREREREREKRRGLLVVDRWSVGRRWTVIVAFVVAIVLECFADECFADDNGR